MSLTPSWNRFLLVPMLTAVVAGGCSEYDSSFVYSERTTSLIPEAQDGFRAASDDAAPISGVKQLLDDRFGDPQDLKAWLKLPVDFGGTPSSIAEYTAVEGVATVKFAVEEGKTLPGSASSVQLVTGFRIEVCSRQDRGFRMRLFRKQLRELKRLSVYCPEV